MWDELGIAPCDDPKAIRRAYAGRLKKLDPDRDPEAFARLRKAFEWALSGAGSDDSPGSSAALSRTARTDREAETAADDLRTTSRTERERDRGEPAAGPSSAPPSAPRAENARAPALQPPIPAPDHDDIRDRALLIALDAALRRRDATEAIALYYRAAATGALSLASAPDVMERLFGVALDDMTLDGAAFRRLVRAAGVDASRSRAPVASELHRRVLARVHAEDWFDDLLATAQQRKGRVARRRARIARLILGRIGRYRHPRVDKAALRTWLAQYKTHAAWLGNRIDPAWVRKLEGRLRRREIFWLVCYSLLIGGLLFQFVLLSVFAVTDGVESLWSLLIGVPASAFLFWLLKLLLSELLRLALPGWSGFAGIAPLQRLRALWTDAGRAIWNRSKAKKPGDAG
jgi:hypothetical protein